MPFNLGYKLIARLAFCESKLVHLSQSKFEWIFWKYRSKCTWILSTVGSHTNYSSLYSFDDQIQTSRISIIEEKRACACSCENNDRWLMLINMDFLACTQHASFDTVFWRYVHTFCHRFQVSLLQYNEILLRDSFFCLSRNILAKLIRLPLQETIILCMLLSHIPENILLKIFQLLSVIREYFISWL